MPIIRIAALSLLLACTSPEEPEYFVRFNTDKITIFEGRFTDVTVNASLPARNLEAGLLSWHVSGTTGAAVGSIVIEYRNSTNTTARVSGFAGDSGYLVVTQGGSPPMDSAVIVVRPVRVATIRLSPDTLRIAVDEPGILYPLLEDSSGTALVRASLDWRVSDTTIATVRGGLGGGASGSGVGLVTGKRAGSTVVFGTVEGLTDSAVVVVRAP